MVSLDVQLKSSIGILLAHKRKHGVGYELDAESEECVQAKKKVHC